MRPAIGMAVAIIVFEGGLNLNLRELRSAGSGVLRLVGVALPLNWLFGTLATRWLAGLSWPVAILVGAILVVTGPTVIMPLLRQARLEPRSAAFLKWEAIVNDPIGATLTLLVLSYLTLATTMSGGDAIVHLAWKTALGGGIAAALGLVLPYGIRTLFRRDLAPEYLKTPILLGGALAVYATGEAIQPETGLVGATLFGVVLANIDVTGLQELKRFKEALTIFLVSGLFILLTANIDRQTVAMLSWPIAGTTLAILFVARPLAIVLATLGAKVSWKERLLVGWIGPRGVVAAAIAGVAGERLSAAGYPDAKLVLPLVFAVIASTVLLHGLSLAPIARWAGACIGRARRPADCRRLFLVGRARRGAAQCWHAGHRGWTGLRSRSRRRGWSGCRRCAWRCSRRSARRSSICVSSSTCSPRLPTTHITRWSARASHPSSGASGSIRSLRIESDQRATCHVARVAWQDRGLGRD